MKLYRYEKACYDETLLDWEDNINVKIVLIEYPVIRETSKGYWILFGTKQKWVSNNCKRRFAYPDKLDAMTNFEKRTMRSIWIMKHNIAFSELALKEAEKIKLTLCQ